MTSNTLAMIQAYLDGGSGSTMEQIIMKQAYGDIVRLIAERDEARRMACLQSCMGDDEPREWSPEDFAKQHGWDCYKDESK
jgi:hypothetical protein